MFKNDPLLFSRFISYFESQYEAQPHVAAIERTDMRAERILVKGERTGVARVSVRPSDSALKVKHFTASYYNLFEIEYYR